MYTCGFSYYSISLAQNYRRKWPSERKKKKEKKKKKERKKWKIFWGSGCYLYFGTNSFEAPMYLFVFYSVRIFNLFTTRPHENVV